MFTSMLNRIALLLAAFAVVGLVACEGGTGGNGAPSDTPASLENVVAEPGYGYVWVTWEFDGSADEFVIYREAMGSTSVSARALEVIGTARGDEREFFDVDVSPGAAYRYSVALQGHQPVGAVGDPIRPNPGNTLRVHFVGSVPEGALANITSEPTGIDCRGPGETGCTAAFASILDVKLNANTNSGFTIKWENCDTTSEGTCTVRMNEQLDTGAAKQRTVTAFIKTIPNTLELRVEEPGTGRVISVNDLRDSTPVNCTNACTYDFPPGLTVGLRAQSADTDNYQFDSWGGACADATGTTCTVTMDAGKSVSAAFELIPPQIQSFSGSPARLTSGQSTTLSWNVTGGGDISIRIEPDVGDVSERLGSISVSPTKTTTYVLTATNTSGTISREQKIVVGNAPLIESLTASPENINPGQTSTLAWSVSGPGEISLTLDQSVGDVTGSNSASVSPNDTTTYTLTASSEFGTDTRSVNVYVGNAPHISGFSASPSHVTPGTESLLTWSASGSGDVTLTLDPGGIDVSNTSHRFVKPSETTTYTLTAESEFGSNAESITVEVGEVPTITSFTADPTTIKSGDSSTLAWSVEPDEGDVRVSLGPDVGDVTGTSSKSVTPSETTTYTLIATNEFGTTQATVAVTVKYTLTISVNDPGTGRVTNENDLGSNPAINCTDTCSYVYSPGLSIALSAERVDGENYDFDSWGGACSGATGSTCTITMDASKSISASFKLSPAVNSVSIQEGNQTIDQRATFQFTATVDATGGADESTVWSTSNDTVATVDAEGLVTGVAPGRANITATSAVDPTKSATVTVTVVPTVLNEDAKLLASDGESTDHFGRPGLGLNGDTAVIGAQAKDGIGTDSGAAYVFVRSGTTWTQQAKLLPSDIAAGDRFGTAIAVSGDTAVITASHDDDNGTDSGSAYVFVRSGTTWTQQAKLLPSDGEPYDHFGIYRIALSGDTAVIGAAYDDDNGGSSGSAYVFVRSGTSWTQQAKLFASDGGTGDHFGVSVALSGDTAVVGAHSNDGNATNSGAAYVFVRSGTTWTQQAKLLASDAEASDHLGISVSLSGDTALISARDDDDKGNDSGSAYVFLRSGTTWTQQAKLLASDGAADDNFAGSVALSGDVAVVGAHDDDDNGKNSGSAYVFVRSGTKWTQQAKLLASDGLPGDWFGLPVAVSDDTVLVGSSNNDENGSSAGAAYVFSIHEVAPVGEGH